MLVLMLRTDKPDAEIYITNEGVMLAQKTWQAHRQLLETIHEVIKETMAASGKKLDDLQGIVIFTGGGSFTGLRIGVSVANALAAGLKIAVVAAEGNDWMNSGQELLKKAKIGQYIEPNYGRPATITKPTK